MGPALEALDAISQRHPVALNRSGLPVELRHALARQEETPATLEQTNARLEATVQRRTAALQAVVRADDALAGRGRAAGSAARCPPRRPGSGHGALLLQAGPQAALHIDGAPPSTLRPSAPWRSGSGSSRVDADLPVRWHATAPGARRGRRTGCRCSSSSGPSGEAAVLLLGTDSPALRTVGAAQAVTRTIARHPGAGAGARPRSPLTGPGPWAVIAPPMSFLQRVQQLPRLVSG